MVPLALGTKLIESSQETPAANVPAVEDPASTTGHADDALLFRTKLCEMFGLFSLLSEGNVRLLFPTFSRVTVFGLSALVAPGAVVAKFRLGASAKSSLNT